MSDTLIRVGQVWQNNDPRREGSLVTITSIEVDQVRGYSERSVNGRTFRRAVVIAKDKLGVENTHGYRMVSDAPPSAEKAPVTAEQADAEAATQRAKDRENEATTAKQLAESNTHDAAVKDAQRGSIRDSVSESA